MATISLRCEACDGVLEVDEDREILSCPYCGSKELIAESDDVRKERIRSRAYTKVELGRQDTAVKLNRDKLNAEAEKDKRSNKMIVFVFCLMVFIAVFSVTIAFLADPESMAGVTGQIVVGSSARQFKGELYDVVTNELGDKGFTNIETIPEEDMGSVSFFVKEFTVDRISINGDSSFSKDDSFPPDATIRVYYHSHPEDSD